MVYEKIEMENNINKEKDKMENSNIKENIKMENKFIKENGKMESSSAKIENKNWKIRIRNMGLWVSIFAFIPVFLKGYGVNILPNNYTEIVSGLLGILVLAGIISNPTDGNWYRDYNNLGKEISIIEEEIKGKD